MVAVDTDIRPVPGPTRPPRRRPPPPARRRRRRRRLLTVLGALIVVLAPLWWSLGSALTDPSLGSSLPGRFAEWLRGHGMATVVVWAETTWYAHHAPPVGGRPPAGAVPPPKAATPTTAESATPAHLPAPAPLAPFANASVAGEWRWQPAGRAVDGVPVVYEAFVPPDPVHTSVVDGIAWMDTKLLRATLYSGSQIPGGGPWQHTAPVQPADATGLVAAFNAGFLTADAQGGYYTQGTTVLPLRTGAASVVIYRDGTATVGQWGRDVGMTPSVVAVRQNLDLIVDGGQPVPGLNAADTSRWGRTLGGQVYVWRSGVGVTADGALVYVGGPGLNITDLAGLLARAGAVRAMELDINTDWVNFSAYAPASASGPASAADGSTLLPQMAGGPGRYFTPSWARDFFTMSLRPSTPAAARPPEPAAR